MPLSLRTLQRVGTETGLVLTVDVLRAAGLDRDAQVLVHAEDGKITITRLDHDVDELVAAADRFVAAHSKAIEKLAE